MAVIKKLGVLITCLMFLLQTCAIAEEGGLGTAISAEYSGDIIEITEQSSDGTITKTAVSAANNSKQAVMGYTSSGTVDFVTRLYQVVLNRNPDAVGLIAWTDALVTGRTTAAAAVEGFFLSPEYLNKGKTAEEVVSDCYNAMLGRSPDPDGKAMWTNALNIGMTSSAVLNGFVASTEFTNLARSYGITPGTITLTSARDRSYARTYFVYRLYANGLGRSPDAAGMEEWCLALENSCTGVDCASGFVFSSEVYNKHLSNADFVELLYNTILGRGATTSEVYTWANVLDFSHTREHVFNGFMLSPEFAAQCAEIQAPVGDGIETVDNTIEWQYNIKMLEELNSYRIAYGVGSILTTREDLWQAAMFRAYELPYRFSNYRPNGDYYTTLLNDMGIDWNTAYERIGGAFTSPEKFCRDWFYRESDLSDNMLDEYKNTAATGYCYYPGSYYGEYYDTLLLE